MGCLNFHHSRPLLPLILFLSCFIIIADTAGSIGVNYDRIATGQPQTSKVSKIQVVAPPSPTGHGSRHGGVEHKWCVANGKVGVVKLRKALDYACGKGRADCDPIHKGGPCYNPNTLEFHASYAFNSYYQMKAHASGTCDFDGAGYVVTQPPKFGNCKFPTRN